ncbi:hypothetical protein CVT25_012866 [Psilocybe cyanescens]|uniref:HD domain-containing protein n=1 Tax=Psilocybe cyanescens TaxID=93625 RepID=A0A409XLQ4_PSICY|nr:hypothetical protein CVT25_012866 [Psilocybe cyanescens]
MYPNLQEKAVVDAAEKIMIDTMTRYDPSHDRHHAALLHDVLDKKYVSPEEAADPFSFFLPFFKSMFEQHGVDLIQDGRAKIITRVIDNVSWTTENKLRAAGQWSAWHDHPLHTAAGDPEYEHATIHHFYSKLVKIRDRLKTAPAKKLGDKRHQVILDFLSSVDEESDGKFE